MSPLDKIKDVLTPHSHSHSHSTTSTSSGADSTTHHEGHEGHHAHGHDTRDEVRSRRAAHEADEAKADGLIHEREATEHRLPPPDESGRTFPSDTIAPADPSVPVQPSSLSTLKPRTSLKRAARHEGPAGQAGLEPDLQGVTHIPESELPVRHDRKEHTATRPSDPFDPKSMDGAPEPSTAGDDLAI